VLAAEAVPAARMWRRVGGGGAERFGMLGRRAARDSAVIGWGCSPLDCAPSCANDGFACKPVCCAASRCPPCRCAPPSSAQVTHLGYYRTEEEAARVYDKVSISLHGDNAQTNFPIDQVKGGREGCHPFVIHTRMLARDQGTSLLPSSHVAPELCSGLPCRALLWGPGACCKYCRGCSIRHPETAADGQRCNLLPRLPNHTPRHMRTHAPSSPRIASAFCNPPLPPNPHSTPRMCRRCSSG
jgi:hypothetical protein